jgi:hypothetical protein
MEQGVDQGSGGIASPGMDYQSGLLVDHKEVLVFVDDGNPYGFCNPGAGIRDAGLEGDLLASPDPVFGGALLLVYEGPPLPDPGLQAGAGIGGE